MNRPLAGGVVLTAVGITGYLAGVLVDYPGRAFSLTAVMVGLTVVAISHRRPGEEAE